MLGFQNKLIKTKNSCFLDSINISEIEFTKSAHHEKLKKVIFKGSEMTSAVTQVAYVELLAGEIIEEHLHDSMEEVFLVLDGNCEFCLDEVSQVLIKGSVIKIAPKIKHKLKALTETKLYYFGVSTVE
jgi:quercetin dioxygenase-like cupin family protein